jgi:hypothetical protein
LRLKNALREDFKVSFRREFKALQANSLLKKTGRFLVITGLDFAQTGVFMTFRISWTR